MKRSSSILAGALIAWAVGFTAAADAEQRVFASPEAAVDAFVAACEQNNTAEIVAIFGPLAASEIERIDENEERSNRTQIAEMAKQIRRIEERADSKRVLLLGYELWPFPMPLVQVGGNWRFDTEAGLDELHRRRVGQNELSAIDVCREFVSAQVEYAQLDRDGDGVVEYAQKVLSAAGKQDGLYWEAALGEEPSPFGPYLAAADASIPADTSQGYMGYRFRILTGQGKHAPGGRYDYQANAGMTEGFALIAWPSDYGRSGVMTFVVNHLGAVYEKDFGPKTEKAVARIKQFDPDPSWKLTSDRQ